MTTFPGPVPDTGYVLPGHIDATEARTEASAWLVSDRSVPQAEADHLVAEAYVAADCWWSDATPEGFPIGAAAGFVASPEYPEAQPVTVVGLSWLYVGGNG